MPPCQGPQPYPGDHKETPARHIQSHVCIYIYIYICMHGFFAQFQFTRHTNNSHTNAKNNNNTAHSNHNNTNIINNNNDNNGPGKW